ncbi:hypothetical protein QPK32_25085 [Massilia sp. YIM B02763]|uniref:hypothetical protein n=1 Tax=Massilia sp. YIM B02763 TaxID=3050130 RepID=UPI0025B6AF7F|nr:hypothetical protein [Massilia sp. YIM B02763]MDN4056346.1 hypothetical protein [Massilia sp. YIM B02763]
MIRRAVRFVGKRLGLLVILVACQLAHVLATTWMLFAILAGSDRAWTIAIGYDQLANATTGGNPDETISSRANRAWKENEVWGCVLCRLLGWLDKDHCSKSAGT